MKLELDFLNYATKSDMKNVKDVHTSEFATSLASLKLAVHKVDIDKLKTFPIGIKNPSDVVEKVVKIEKNREKIVKL